MGSGRKFYSDEHYREWVIKRLHKRTKIDGECWRYLGEHVLGYGRSYWKSKKVLVHRISAHLFLGFDLESSKLILHKDELCKFKDCWNPKHLYIGSHSQNANDRQADKLRKSCHQTATTGS